MDTKSNRARNWREYNQALVNRGSLTFWFSEECLTQWVRQDRPKKPGRPEKYPDMTIECGLVLKSLFGLTFRSAEGFIQSLLKLLGLKLDTPDYSLLCKRQKNLSIKLPKKRQNSREKINILVDTTGLKVYGEGEWKVRQHGWIKHRLWRKLHLAINEKTGEIEALSLTDLGIQDCQGLPLLVEQIESEIDTTKGDGAYDRFSCYDLAEERKFKLISPPQRNAATSDERTENRKKGRPEAVKKRDENIQEIRLLGRKEWKEKTGYHRRSLAETAMFRVKTLLGNRLSSRKFENQQVEARIWCTILNKMTAMGAQHLTAVN